jgi:long-chain acyl-CoA synthetase
MNIADLVERQARERPDAPAIIAGARVMSYARLNSAVDHIAAALRTEGLAPGDVVGSAWNLAPEQVILTLALARLGAVSIALYPRDKLSTRKSLVEQFGATAIVLDQSEFAVPGCRTIFWRSLQRVCGRESSGAPRFEGGHKPWAILFSSGTSGGRPKAILRTHAEAVALAGRQSAFLGIKPGHRYLCNMSLNLAAAQMRVLRHVLFGSAVVFPTGDSHDTIERYGVTHALVTPNTLEEWVTRLTPDRKPLKSLVHLACGGGPVLETVRRQCFERLTPSLFINYGTVETALTAMADPDTQQRFPGSVGRVVPWIEVGVVDERNRPVPSAATGFLRFRGEGVATAYHGITAEPGITEKAFRDGWFYPGDVGRIGPDGLLYVEGRSDDVINVGGRKVSASEIEAVLIGYPGIAAAAAFSKMSPSAKAVSLAVVVTSGAVDWDALQQHCRAELGNKAPSRILRVTSIPRNAMGKVDKQELARSVAMKEEDD